MNAISFRRRFLNDRCLSRNAGFTIVEVMVGLALSMLSMLIILQLFEVSDARKRMTTGAAEGQQTANVSLYQLGRTVRLAGAGLTQANNLWGCPIQAFRATTQILPAAAFPSPFNTVSTTVRALPILIHPAAAPGGSDIIAVVAGNSEIGQAELQMLAPPRAASLTLRQMNGVKPLDLILMTAPDTISNCQIAQVDTTLTDASRMADPNTLPLGGTGTLFNTATGLTVAPFALGSIPLHLGRTPIFAMFGINASNSLVQYDLLSSTASVTADNVFDLRARYGVVNASGGGPITWQSPDAAGWDVASLTAGTTAALDLIDRIRAVRIAMVFRSTEPADEVAPPTQYVMFPDASPITVSLSTAQQRYRYQVYESVIPLRNLQYVPTPRPPL